MGTYVVKGGQVAEGVHAGVNAAVCNISLSTTPSAGDYIVLGRIPHGAIPLDSVFYPGSALTANAVLKFGTSASPSAFLTSATYTTQARTSTAKRLGWVAQVSLSDDRMPRYDNLVMVNAAGIVSAGFMGTFVAFYKMPGQTP